MPACSRKTSAGNASRTSCCWVESEFSGRFKLVVTLGPEAIPDLACSPGGAVALFQIGIAILEIVRRMPPCFHPLHRVPGATKVCAMFGIQTHKSPRQVGTRADYFLRGFFAPD